MQLTEKRRRAEFVHVLESRNPSQWNDTLKSTVIQQYSIYIHKKESVINLLKYLDSLYNSELQMIYTKCTPNSEIINGIAYVQITLTTASNTLHLHIYTLEKVKLHKVLAFIKANARQL